MPLCYLPTLRPRRKHYVSYSSPVILEPLVASPAHIYIPSTSHHARIISHESDDTYCRRKDRYYELLADELIATKKQRDQVKKLQDSATNSDELRKWKRAYEKLADEVVVLERRVEEQRGRVVRRYRL